VTLVSRAILFRSDEPFTRAGHDDACAILFAAYHPQLELLGISTVYGNAPLEKTTNNALAILEAIGKPAIPVFPGVKNPFGRTIHTATDIHGESGLDGTDLLPKPSRTALSHCNAIREMRDTLLACPPSTAWLVATGALTNVALLFATFPEVATHVKGLSIMGGAIGNDFTSVTMGPAYKDKDGEMHARIGNRTAWAEFNIWCDPEASRSLLQNPVLKLKTILIPLDVTHQAYAGKDIQELLLHGKDGKIQDPTRLRRMFNELLMFFASTYAQMFHLKEGPPLHDPLAVAALLAEYPDPSSRIDFDDRGGERWDVDVVPEGQELGRTVAKASKEGTMVPRTLDLEKFWTELEKCMARADETTGHRR
jgi:uridine nucleosidase